MNVPVQSNNFNFTDKLFVIKPVKIGDKIVKTTDCDKLNLREEACIKFFAEDCVERLIHKMLEIETNMKISFEDDR